MSHIISVIIALGVCAQAPGSSADPQTKRFNLLRARLWRTGAALASGNYARLVDLTYPKVVEMIGGRDIDDSAVCACGE